MNPDSQLPLQTENHDPHADQKLAAERAAALRDEEWQLHNECITLAREALEHYKAQGEKRLRIPDLVRILELASRLGRLATGIPTEQIEHAWSEYHHDLWTAQCLADLHKIYGQPIEVAGEVPHPADENCSSRREEALTSQSAATESHDTQS